MQGIKISGIASYIPETVIENNDFTSFIETNDEWITTRTGIKTRHCAMNMPTWKMGSLAARKAIERSGISGDEIDLIICSTVTPDTLIPSTACLIQNELGLNGCQAFDINSACSGFVYAVDMAHKYISAGSARNVLVVSAESLSRVADYTDRSSCILFGDGSAAAVISPCEGKFSSVIGADGSGAGFLRASSVHPVTHPLFAVKGIEPETDENDHGQLYQDGKEVYKFAVATLPRIIGEVLEKAGLTADDIDSIVPHQANIRIIQTAASKLGLPMEKFFLNIEKYGNTSSASIPIALTEAVETGFIKRGDKIVLAGFGAGLTYGAICMEF
ncbi:beta-ketoacyl-ACP synthase III [Ruminococcus sp. HUN007]|uniref:beta-ketoacyl-ACP synthase III n=1 Tax=Ruminococcus sp. HUN007 TaxID=1514668 RepID=UPI0006796039|nr:beta-ketoacyl-ACP synthase III [Ruminococcus sp. HUN007]